jgi:hypothetical protein
MTGVISPEEARPMFTTAATTTASWRHVVVGAPVNASVVRPVATYAMDPTTFAKGLIARPTRRGAPPH